METPANKAEILPWLLSGWRLVVIMTLAVVALLAVVWAMSGNDVPTGKGKKLVVNESIDEGKNAVVANLIANQEEVVTNAEVKADQANANLANSLMRDSNSFSGSQSDADDAFCNRYPRDSTCAEWRLRHGR